MLRKIKALFQEKGISQDEFRWLWKLLRPYRGKLLFLILLRCSLTVVGVGSALVNKYLVDYAAAYLDVTGMIVLTVACTCINLLGGMLLSPCCADVFSPKVQRSAMGSGFRVGVWIGELPAALRALQAQGYRIVASSLQGAPFYEAQLPRERFVLVIGNEARGVSDEVMELADVRLKLPMRGGAESLNAAVAAGIMMYELTRTLAEH